MLSGKVFIFSSCLKDSFSKHNILDYEFACSFIRWFVFLALWIYHPTSFLAVMFLLKNPLIVLGASFVCANLFFPCFFQNSILVSDFHGREMKRHQFKQTVINKRCFMESLGNHTHTQTHAHKIPIDGTQKKQGNWC